MFLKYQAIRFCVVVAALAGLQGGAAEIKSAEDLKDVRQKGSYALGAQTATNWERQGANIDWDAFVRGAEDAVGGGALLLTDEERKEAVTAFRNEVQARQRAKNEEEGAKNKAAGEKFLAENKTKEGVITTASGLQYKVITMGTGPKPKPTDKVTFHYTGTLIDGKKFDSSVDRGTPLTHPVNELIPGWVEGLQLMPTGSKFQFFIPSDLAYKDRAPSSIGPSQVLLFDVELLSIGPSTSPQPAAAATQQPVTSDIIKVPSAEELAKGAKIEIIKPEDVQKEIEKEKARKKDQPEK